jgi:hypothetical protein
MQQTGTETHGTMPQQIPLPPILEPRAEAPRPEDIEYVRILEASAGVTLDQGLLESIAAIGDRREINKCFFATIATMPKAPKVADVDFSQLEKAHQERVDKLREDQIGRYIVDINANQKAARDRMMAGQEYLRMATLLRAKLASLEKQTVTIQDELKKICENPFYTFKGIVSDSIGTSAEFITGRVIMRYTEPIQGIDMQLDFGQFLVSWSTNGDLYVYGYKDNTDVRGYLHPHVSSGSVCYGNTADAFTNAAAKGKISDCFTIVQSILHTYNPDSPYVTLESFFLQKNRATIKLDELDTHWEEEGKVWINDFAYDGTLSRTLDTSTYENDDGDDIEITKTYIYTKKYTKYGCNVEPRVYALKSSNGRYVEIEEGEVIYEWV